MKKKLALLSWIILISLAACGSRATPTLAPTAALPTATATPTPTTAPPSPTPSVEPTTSLPSPTLTVVPTTAVPPTQSPPPTTTVPPSATPTAPPPTLAPTSTPPPNAVVLTVPLDTPLMPLPPDRPDQPSVGVSALDLAPDFAADPTMIAGTRGNGVLLSWNGGGTWSWATAGLSSDATVTALTIGTGEDMAAIIDHATAYRSRDGGMTWEPIPGLGDGVTQVAYSPAYAADGIIFAARSGALLRSSDRGATWTTVLPANNCPINVALSPSFGSDGTALAPRCNQVVISTDRGVSWQPIPGEGPDLQVGNLSNLKTAPDYPGGERLLAQGDVQGLPLISRDGGATWVRAYDPDQAPFLLGTVGNVYFAPGTTFYATGRTSLYDTQVSLWLSHDEGATWFAIGLVPGYEQPALRVDDDGTLWAGTAEGVFKRTGGGWSLVHPGGSRLPVIALVPEQVALVNQSAGKYTTRVQIYEKPGGAWLLFFDETTNSAPRRAFPAPNYPAERLILALNQDYGGGISVVMVRPEDPEPFQIVAEIPPGPGDSLPNYEVAYAGDYPESGRIELRHGHSGALYISTDRGVTWSRPDPLEPGACARTPVSGFGALWFNNAEVRNLLLCPLEDEQPYTGIVQPFERGEMLRLESLAPPAEITVYALLPDWEGEQAWTTMPYYDTDRPLPEPPAGLFRPDPLLKTAWLEGACCRPNAQPAQQALGWATAEAAGTGFVRQQFEGGTLVWRQDRDEILVLFSTPTGDRYEVYPD